MPLWPSLLVTTTLTDPDGCDAVVAVMEVLLTTCTPVAAVPPRLTVAPDRKPAPVMVAVAPDAEPLVGEIEFTEGAGFDPELPN